jgi:hypothetical protein
MIFILFNIYLSALLSASVTGVVSVGFHNEGPVYIKVLPWFVLLTFVVEVFAYFYAGITGSNQNIFNVFLIIQHLFYSFVLCQMIRSQTVRKRILYVVCVYSVMAVTLVFFIQGINYYNSIVYFVGGVMLSFFSGYFLYELFRVPGKENLLKRPSFWIACGILLYNSCTIPLVIPWPVLMHCTPFELKILHILLTLVYFTSYSLFTVAFIFHFLSQKMFIKADAVNSTL